MKNNRIKIWGAFVLIAAFGAMALSSCEDEVKTPLATAQGEVTDVSYTSLRFKWGKVADAIQYEYTLTDAEGNVSASGVTQDNFVEITGLEPATEYTLSVLAYAAMDGDNTTSAPLELRATTLTASMLATPVLNVEVEGRYALAGWNAIPFAEEYSYELKRDGEIHEEGSVTDSRLSFSALDPGVYVLTVKAQTSDDAYTDSETVASFHIVRNELWRVAGTYTSALIDGSWAVTMIAYSDDSYELLDWYNTNDNNLNFFIDMFSDDGAFEMSASEYEYNDDSKAFAVPAGRSGLPIVYVFPYDTKRFVMTGDKDGGTLEIAVKNRNSSTGSARRDRFVWGTDLK